MDFARVDEMIRQGPLQFGHAWAAWMDGVVGGDQQEQDGLQFGHAWAAWMDLPSRQRLPALLRASIRPRLGSVDGPERQPLACAALHASIRPRLGSVDGHNDEPSRVKLYELQFGHAWAAWMDAVSLTTYS